MECGGCTACCFTSEVSDLGKPRGKWCEHCNVGAGCKIYELRPPQCREFECAYIQSGKSVRMRPDMCGVVFEKLSDIAFFGTVMGEANQDAMDQVLAFNRQGFSVIIAMSGNLQLFLADGHTKDMIHDELRKFLNGNIRN